MRELTLKVLIIGGYGTFGGRLAYLLADEPRLTLMIAGRSLHKADQFVAGLRGQATLTPLEFDRDADAEVQIAETGADIVVDASGPFQAYGHDPYRVVRAALACGAGYIDLADDPAFVKGIAEFDADAKKRSLFVLSGASTGPALTTAVARKLTHDLRDLHSLTAGIAPSPHPGVGRTAIEAIAGYAGKPIEVWRNDIAATAHAFTETRRFRIAPPGQLPMRRLTFSLVDVPDLTLLCRLEPRPREVWFGAAPVPAGYHALLRLLARATKLGLLPSVRPLAPLMAFVTRRLAWGANRGGMFVDVRGTGMQGQAIHRSWHLVAEGGVGTTVPAIPAAILLRNGLRNIWPKAGARPASDEISLEEFESVFDGLDVVTGARSLHVPDGSPPFPKVLADAWTDLPPRIRDLHCAESGAYFSGLASVSRGRSLAARLVAKLVGFPPAGRRVSVSVRIDRRGDKETWRRDFAGKKFKSELSAGEKRFAELLCERFGPIRFGIALVHDAGRLRYRMHKWTFLGLPMPRWLLPTGSVYEFVEDDRFNFHVDITLPLIGHVVTYRGWLEENAAS